MEVGFIVRICVKIPIEILFKTSKRILRQDGDDLDNDVRDPSPTSQLVLFDYPLAPTDPTTWHEGQPSLFVFPLKLVLLSNSKLMESQLF
jgi:hypothetical protein